MEGRVIKVVNNIRKNGWKLIIDATLELSPVTLLVGPNANEFLRAMSFATNHVIEYDNKGYVMQIDERLYKEAELLIDSELNEMLRLAAEMKLVTNIHDLVPVDEPFVDMLKHLYSLVADGDVYFLANEPTCSLAPQQRFFLGHLTSVFTKKARERGVELYTIISTNDLEFIRGATATWSTIYLIRRNIEMQTKTIMLTATKWERRDIVPPFFDSAALAIRRGVLDFGKTT